MPDIIAQAYGLIALLFYIITVQQKSKPRLLLFNIIGDIFMIISYALLLTLSGEEAFAVCIIFAVIIFFAYRDKLVPFWLMLVFDALSIAAVILF